MKAVTWIKTNKSHAILIALEVLTVLVMCCVALINRKNVFLHLFEFDDLHLKSDVIVNTYEGSGENYITAAEGTTESGVIVSTSALTLKPGTYHVNILYDTSHSDNFMYADCLGALPFEAGPVTLENDSNTAYMTLTTFTESDYCFNVLFIGEGAMNVHSISVVSTNERYYRFVIYSILASLFAEFIFFLITHKKNLPTTLTLTATVLVALIPLFTDSLYVGADLPFHLSRIEGIAQGLRNKMIPVKVAPFWAQGYGYSVGVFYGDLLLYFPAVLRLFGINVQNAFKLFVAGITIGTVFISYFSFKDIFKKEKTAVITTVLYTLSIYRLMDVFTRIAVGEYVALMFMPLFAMGIFGILKEEKPSFKYVIFSSFGITGIIGSHVLSAEMTAIFLVIFLLCFARKTFRPKTIVALLKVVGISILLNIGFLLPFADFYTTNINIKSADWAGGGDGFIQKYGLFVSQLFAPLGNANGGTWAVASGTDNEACFKIGLCFVVFLVLFFIAFFKAGAQRKTDTRFKYGLTVSIISLLAMFMTTYLFPWDGISKLGSIAKALITPIQFPWRFLAIATLFLTILAGITLEVAEDYLEGTLRKGFYVLSATFLTTTLVWYYYDYVRTNVPVTYYGSYEVPSGAIYSAEYLLEGTDTTQFKRTNVIPKNLDVESINRGSLSYTVSVAGAGDDASIELALNYYKYYRATDLTGNCSLNVTAGDNNRVRVNVPTGYSGTFLVSWHEPIHWRLAEAVSLLTFMVLCISLVKTFKKSKSFACKIS